MDDYQDPNSDKEKEIKMDKQKIEYGKNVYNKRNHKKSIGTLIKKRIEK